MLILKKGLLLAVFLLASTTALAKQTMVSLAPSITELVYAAGAEDQLLAVDRYSDYPPQAKSKPIIGDAFNLNYEQLALLAPDVVLYWPQGTPAKHVQQLAAKGYTLHAVEVNELQDLPQQLKQIAAFAAVDADNEANRLSNKILALKPSNHNKRVSAFYMIGTKPIFTVNAEHLVSKTLAYCGGENVFAKSPIYAPQIGLESVIAANPDIIITGVKPDFDDRWQQISAVKNNKILEIDPDWLSRPSPRFLLAAEKICQAIASY